MTAKTMKCLYCGKNFSYQSRQTQREYCSRQCGSRATYNKGSANTLNKVWGYDKKIFDTAMVMYWSGEESSTIARRLNIPIGTMYSWVHDYGNRRQRVEPIKKRLKMAENADEWLEALRENVSADDRGFDDLPIRLVCGRIHGQSISKCTSVIYERLQDNPLNGNVYAFCNKTRTAITTFVWKEPVFQITKNIRMHGTFIWPDEELGKTIEVTKSEFNRLLLLNKQGILAEKVAKNVDIVRFSCYN